MVVKCKLIDQCLDCREGHIDVFNEIVRTTGSIMPETVASTIYCKHMNVCEKYRTCMEGDHLVMVPLNHFIDEAGEDQLYSVEAFEEGDGINE